MVIEIFITMIRDNQNITGLKVFNYEFKFTSYADDTTCFVKNVESIQEIIQTFDIFSKYFGLLLNT